MTKEPDCATAQCAAWRLQEEYAIVNPATVQLENLAMELGILVEEGGLDGSEARLYRKGKRGVIRIRDGILEIGRRRFALAHELGHWELHPSLFQVHVCSESDIRDYAGSWPEIEANIFASELLMPRGLFTTRCAGLDLSLESVAALASEFLVTLTAAAVRLVDLNSDGCFVVFSEQKRVRWWRKSRSACGLWLESSQKVDPLSHAWDCFEGRPSLHEMRRVKIDTWFPHVGNQDKMVSLFEQSTQLGSYPTVLTLLWMTERDEEESW